MQKYQIIVEVDEEVFARLKQGKKVPGQMFADAVEEVIKFGAFGHGKKRHKDLLIKVLEHGWVKESKDRIKVYDSLPKELGLNMILKVLEREMNLAAKALAKRDEIENV